MTGVPRWVYFLRRRRWHLRGGNRGQTYGALGLVDPQESLARVINLGLFVNGASLEDLTEGPLAR